MKCWVLCSGSYCIVNVTKYQMLSNRMLTYCHNILCYIIYYVTPSGIWIRDIRFKTNLILHQLNRIVKNLESKKLIKAVKSVSVRVACNGSCGICTLFCSDIDTFAIGVGDKISLIHSCVCRPPRRKCTCFSTYNQTDLWLVAHGIAIRIWSLNLLRFWTSNASST